MPIPERELVIPALRAAAASATGEITTSDLIQVLTDHFEPDGKDAQIAQGRSDTYFSQKVRNLISHRDSGGSMFTKGYAVYQPEGEAIRITNAGRAFLGQVPEA